MHKRNFLIVSAFILVSGIIAIPLHAQTMDVDQADTIDFQSFHKDKKEAVKVWDKTSNTPTKTYSDSQQVPPTNSTPGTAASAAAVPAAIAATSTSGDTKGKRFELRERYTLTRSAKTPYSAFYVIEPLYKQAAQFCLKGWRKLTERSEPIEQDYYLYYEIECL